VKHKHDGLVSMPISPSRRPADYVLFPGRHHLLTRFQADYLGGLVRSPAADLNGEPAPVASAATIVWAVTSANHQNTRRNPVPYNRREAAIERFSASEGIRSLVIPIFDTAETGRFGEVTLKNVENATEGQTRLTPDNCVVACSTPAVFDLYRALGFRILPVEFQHQDTPDRPWDVLMRLVAGDESWRELAHPATVDIYERYALIDLIRRVHSDPVVGDEGGLTETRQYRTYVESFEKASERKWEQVGPYVRPGRVLDIGCASGGMLEVAARDRRLWESDLIGVEVARHLYEECLHKKAQGAFANPNVYFYQRNLLVGGVFPDGSIDTTITVALTHEIFSYGERASALRAFTETVYRHTVPGGVWVNSDVLGPADPDAEVVMSLRTDDGANPPQPRHDIADLSTEEVMAYVGGLSTRARLDQFKLDFPSRARADFSFAEFDDNRVRLTLRDAMEFLETKDYVDNWLSECHEQFCALSFDDWVALVQDVGFEVEPASHAWRNDWLVDNRFAPVARLATTDGQPVEWPVTHLLLVCRRPDNT
jgi:SAM-dependent methyltransferase